MTLMAVFFLLGAAVHEFTLPAGSRRVNARASAVLARASRGAPAAYRTRGIDGRASVRDSSRVHLADLLVAAAVFGVVSAAVLTVLQEGLQGYTLGAPRAGRQQDRGAA